MMTEPLPAAIDRLLPLETEADTQAMDDCVKLLRVWAIAAVSVSNWAEDEEPLLGPAVVRCIAMRMRG